MIKASESDYASYKEHPLKWISTQVIQLSSFWRIHLERRSFTQVQSGGRYCFHYDPSGDLMSASEKKEYVKIIYSI